MKFLNHTWHCELLVTWAWEIIWQNLYMLLLLEWSWCPHVRILFLLTPLSLNMWTNFSISASAWGQARSKLGGVDTSILHHAFISIFTTLWAVITRYVTILMPILSYFTRFTWRGRMPAAGILGWKRSKFRDLFCTAPKVLKLHRSYFWN